MTRHPRALIAISLLLFSLSKVEAVEVGPLVTALGQPDAAVRIRAIDDLGALGPTAQPAVEALVKLLDDPNADVRWHAARTLGAIGPGAVAALPALEKHLTDEQARVRAYACFAIGQQGQAAKPLVPKLVQSVNDADAMVRREAIRAVRAIRPGPTVVVPLLIDVLKQAKPEEVGPVLQSLAELRDKAVPGLIETFKHADAQYWAALVLADLGPEGKGAVTAAMGALKHPDPHVRFETLVALGQVGAGAGEATPAIVPLLDDPEAAVRHAAMYALGAIGPFATSAEPKLQGILASKDPTSEVFAAWALAQIVPSDVARRRVAVPLLIRAMSDPQPRVRQFAINAVGQWKLTDAVVLTALIERLGDAEPRNVVQASTVLAELGEPAYNAVVAALEVPTLTSGAIMTLGRMGPKAAAAASKLQELTIAKTPGTRIEAMVALANVAPQSGATTVALLNRLATDDAFEVRHAAVEGLVHLGLTPAITAALDKAAQQDVSPLVREAASAALGKK